MEKKNLKNSIFSSDHVLKNGFTLFLELEQEFCLGLFRYVSWDLHLPKYIIKPLLAICPDYFARMTTLLVVV